MHARPNLSNPPADSPEAHVDADAAVAFAQDLIRLRTVNAAGAEQVERPAAELVASLFSEFGWEHEVVEVAPGRPNVIAMVGRRRRRPDPDVRRPLDVVTEGDPAAWTVDPYGAEIRAGSGAGARPT